MKWWKKFWKLRKQNDVIKVMLFFFAAGTAFCANAIYNGILLYQEAQSPAEYIITGEFSGNIQDTKWKKIRELEDVAAISRQTDNSITMQYQGSETTFTCTVLSKEYLEAVYGIKESGAATIFYVNQIAFDQLKQDMSNPQAFEQAVKNNSLLVNYTAENQPLAGTDSLGGDTTAIPVRRTAKIVLMENSISDSPYVCYSGNGSALAESTALRVCFRRQNADNENAQKLQMLGFTIETADLVQETEYTIEIQIVRIGHSIIAALICLACTAALWKYGCRSNVLFLCIEIFPIILYNDGRDKRKSG